MSTNTFQKHKREKSRRELSVSEGINVEFKLNDKSISAKVASISPGGIAIFCNDLSIDEINKLIDQTITICICPTGIESFNLSVIIKNYSTLNSEFNKYYRIGMKIDNHLNSKNNIKRISQRFTFNEFLRPTLTFENPFFVYNQIFGHVIDISEKSLKFETSARNNSLLPGIKTRFSIYFPLAGNCNFDGRIIFCQPSNTENRILVGIEFLNNTEEIQSKATTVLLMQNKDLNANMLRENGFATGSLIPGLSLEYALTDSQKSEIWDLRLLALHSTGQLLDRKNSTETIDKYDQYSRHLIARLNGKIVASARLVFNNGHIDRCEHHSYGAHIPEWLWKKGFVETSRLVTHPDFRGSDVFLAIMQLVGKTVVESSYEYNLVSCNKNLVSIYETTGAKKISTFTFDNSEWTLMLQNTIAVGLTHGINPIYWNIVSKNISNYLIRRGMIKPNLIESIRIWLYKKFSPLSDYILKKKVKKRTSRQKSPR